jgi:hypothetical protein
MSSAAAQKGCGKNRRRRRRTKVVETAAAAVEGVTDRMLVKDGVVLLLPLVVGVDDVVHY